MRDDRRDAGARRDEYPNFQFGIASTIFASNLEDAKNILAWARAKKLDIVFNMLRFTDAMLNNKELEATVGFHEREEQFMRDFFLDRVQEESVFSGQSFMYLHYADMIANGYKRTMPCPFRSQGLLLNPYGDLHYCENSKAIGNVLTTPAEKLYFRAENLAHREEVKNDICPTCLSPCQVNVGAMKQFVPYAKFLVRAYQVKQRPQPAPRNPSHASALSPSGQPPRGFSGPVASGPFGFALRLVIAGGITGYLLWKVHPREVLAATSGRRLEADWRGCAARASSIAR